LVFGVKNGVTSLRDRLVSSNDFYKATETLENEKRPNATSDLYEMTPEESSHFEDREERD
jgi:hypothetical protein